MAAVTLASQRRLAKGINLSQLVSVLRKQRRRRSLGAMSPAAAQLLEERILDSAWYPHEPFVDLLRVMYREVLGSREEHALDAGVAGGKVALRGAHKTFVIAGDPIASALAMRHSWRSYFNFGALVAVREGDDAVLLTLTGYADVEPVHAGLIVGWAVAAAQLGGAPESVGEILSKPWVAGDTLVYRVTVRP